MVMAFETSPVTPQTPLPHTGNSKPHADPTDTQTHTHTRGVAQGPMSQKVRVYTL